MDANEVFSRPENCKLIPALERAIPVFRENLKRPFWEEVCDQFGATFHQIKSHLILIVLIGMVLSFSQAAFAKKGDPVCDSKLLQGTYYINHAPKKHRGIMRAPGELCMKISGEGHNFYIGIYFANADKKSCERLYDDAISVTCRILERELGGPRLEKITQYYTLLEEYQTSSSVDQTSSSPCP